MMAAITIVLVSSLVAQASPPPIEYQPSLVGTPVAEGTSVAWCAPDTLVIVNGGRLQRCVVGAEPGDLPLPPPYRLAGERYPLVSPTRPTEVIAAVIQTASPTSPLANLALVTAGPKQSARTLLSRSRIVVSDPLAWASWSADGRQIAYVAEQAGPGPRVGLSPQDGTHEPESDAHAGSLASDVASRQPAWTAVWTFDVETGTEQQLTCTPGCDDSSPTFSPDGKQIVFCRAFPDRIVADWRALSEEPLPACGLASIDIETKRITDLTSGQLDFTPSFSPDGRHVAFVRMEPSYASLWLYDLVQDRATRLTSGALYPDLRRTRLTWSADGKYVMFACDGAIYAAPMSGALPLRLTDATGITDHWAISPDEGHVAFARSGSIYLAGLKWPAAVAALPE